MIACKHKNGKECALLEVGLTGDQCGLINSDFCKIHQLSSGCLALKIDPLIKIEDDKSRSRSAAIFERQGDDCYGLVDLEALIGSLQPEEGVLKADKLFIRSKGDSNGIIIELKGIDLKDATEQVKSSLRFLKKNQICTEGVSALVVFTVNKMPGFGSFEQKEIRAFRNLGGKNLRFKASSKSSGRRVVNGHRYQDFF